ncbi:MAG: lamin tail domain-containing protein [Myxococcota bacterium]
MKMRNSLGALALVALVGVWSGCDSATSSGDDGSTADVTTDTTGGDIAGDTSGDATDTSGDTNPAVQPLFVNEIVAKGTITADNPTGSDWVELYNAGTQTVDLAGYLIGDKIGDTAEALPLPTGVTIAAKGFVVVFFNHAGAGFPVVDKALGKGEQAALFAPDGTPIDGFNWAAGDSPEGGSYGRFPDGSPTFKSFSAPTFAAPNK